MADAAPLELRVLARLGLSRVSSVDALVLVLKRFRAAQLRDLDDLLQALPPHVVAHIEALFDRKIDVKDELERYVLDLLKIVHLVRHLQIEGDAKREIETLVAALGDGGDRALLTKMLQTLGARLARALCAVSLQLPSIRLQQDFYRVFAVADGGGMAALKAWMQWLDGLHTTTRHWEMARAFLIKCTVEKCLALWLRLLTPVAAPTRMALIERLETAETALLHQIGRFHDVTGLPITKFLELCDGFRAELPLLLTEFPMATTLTLCAKFNNDTLISCVVKAMYLFGKGDVMRLVDALALEESLCAIKVFFVTLVEFERRQAIVALFLVMPRLSQARLLLIATRMIAPAVTSSGDPPCEETSDGADLSAVLGFLLDGRLHATDEVLRKLIALPAEEVVALTRAMKKYAVDELVLVAEGIEAISDGRCLETFLRLFHVLPPSQRPMLVDWVHDMPGEAALPLYAMLFRLYASSEQAKAASILQMMASLNKPDKRTLCCELLEEPVDENNRVSVGETNARVVEFLANCESSRRHQCVKLLAAIDRASFDALLYLFRTQRMPEQVALTKVMLSLSTAANGRLLAKLRALEGERLDEFFQLLLLIPKVEYKMLSRLLVSQEVSLDQFQVFVHVAANMMNQAASREMVIFASELPPRFRNLFFEMLSQCTPAEKGVVMRIVACSTRLPPDVLHLFVELLLRIPWETRSALVEQLRALEDSTDSQTYVIVLREFDDDAWLPRMVHLLNLLPLLVRISIVPLFEQISSVVERKLALAKLNAMRKDQLPVFCKGLCASGCLPFISSTFLRILGYLQDEYQSRMLHLLLWRTCWVFIEVLATSLETAALGTSDGGVLSRNAALVNGLAASLTILKHETDFVLLGDVMEEAMGNGIRLEELIVVFAHFREGDHLLAFLRYVVQLTRVARSTLFFRVLSRSQATVFLFDMCHVLDLDDTLFALKRLDRMWSRDAESLNKMLVAMSQKGAAVDARDEFCHLVLGFRERVPAQALGLDGVDEHHVARDRGSSIFHKQCVYENERGPSRIRVARTAHAHAKVLAVRVEHALGVRHINASSAKPSLLRSERHTIEQAAAAIALGEQSRSRSRSQVVGWIHKNTLG